MLDTISSTQWHDCPKYYGAEIGDFISKDLIQAALSMLLIRRNLGVYRPILMELKVTTTVSTYMYACKLVCQRSGVMWLCLTVVGVDN